MNATPSRKISPAFQSAKRIVAIVVAIPCTAILIRQLWGCLRGGGDALSSILIGFFPAAVALVCWWFAVRWLFANRRKRTTSAPLGNVTEWPDAVKSAPSRKIDAVI